MRDMHGIGLSFTNRGCVYLLREDIIIPCDLYIYIYITDNFLMILPLKYVLDKTFESYFAKA